MPNRGQSMWRHRVDWLPRECGGSGTFGDGSPYRPRSSCDPSINGHLHYPNDIDRSLNETVTDKIRKYRVDYNNNPPNSTVINFCVFQGGVIQVTCV